MGIVIEATVLDKGMQVCRNLRDFQVGNETKQVISMGADITDTADRTTAGRIGAPFGLFILAAVFHINGKPVLRIFDLDQADVAKAALKSLADAAQKALAEATTAAEAAASAFTEQSDNAARLKAQLATLTTNVDHLESEYVDGIKALWGELAGLGAGKISSTGWVRPAGGHLAGYVVARFGSSSCTKTQRASPWESRLSRGRSW